MSTIRSIGQLISSRVQQLADHARRGVSLRDLDRRTLVDIGVDPSEIGSIEAESRGRSQVTRLRITSTFSHV